MAGERLGATLVLKRASASRTSGEWGEDDFDVLAAGIVVGRIMKAMAAPEGTPWMWTLALGIMRVAYRPTIATTSRGSMRRLK
jgi:hypothetical protein